MQLSNSSFKLNIEKFKIFIEFSYLFTIKSPIRRATITNLKYMFLVETKSYKTKQLVKNYYFYLTKLKKCETVNRIHAILGKIK